MRCFFTILRDGLVAVMTLAFIAVVGPVLFDPPPGEPAKPQGPDPASRGSNLLRLANGALERRARAQVATTQVENLHLRQIVAELRDRLEALERRQLDVHGEGIPK